MILVTGGTGFVGSHLIEKLNARGEAVRCLVRATSNVRGLPAGVQRAVADLERGQGIDEALEGVDTVIHLAGATKAFAPADFFTANVRATENLVRALQGRRIK